jgi:SPP1 gp7 family putative phage head morphogenesis protein
MPSANKAILDQIVAHAHNIEEMKMGEVLRSVKAFNDATISDLVGDVTQRLGNLSGPSGARYMYLRQSVTDQIGKGLEQAKKELLQGVKNSLRQEMAWQTKAFKAIAPDGTKINRVSAATIKKFTDKLRVEETRIDTLFRQIQRDTTSRIMNTIRRGMWDDLPVSDILSQIRGTKTNRYVDGILNKTRSQIEAVVRSAHAEVIENGKEAFFQENKHLVKAVQLTAVLDERTTAYCRSIDGDVYPVGEGPRPPFHYNCRTTTTPVLRSAKELGLDQSQAKRFTGTPADKLTYNDWLKRQRPDVQDQILGATRGELYRSGKVQIERFVNNRGRQLTIAELMKREGLGVNDLPEFP